MFDIGPEAFRRLALFAPPFIICLTFHEYAHAWVANKLGDSTAKYLGRLTMDPMAHMSWMGTVLFPAIAVLTGAPLFGWANPVPVDMRNFKKQRAGMAIVAAAGPASNILLAVISTAALSIVAHQTGLSLNSDLRSAGMGGAAVEMLLMAVQLNLFLAFFNLLPIPPLDGSRILQGLVSNEHADKIDQFAAYGQILLLFLFFSKALHFLVTPVITFMAYLFTVLRVPIV